MEQPAIIFRTLNTTKGILQIAQRPFDGYIEVTPMCHAVGKNPWEWGRNQFAKDYLNALSLETQICVSNLIQVIKGRGDRMEQGTWVHPYIASRIAQWCHPFFAIQVDKWVLEILSGRAVPPQRPPMTQALVDALDAHDAHFFQVDSRLDAHDTRLDAVEQSAAQTKSQLTYIEQAYYGAHKKHQANAQRRNPTHPNYVIREKAFRFAAGRCMCCDRKLALWDDEATTAQPVAHVDHVDPVDAGGDLVWPNLQVLCPGCNQRKKVAELSLGRHDHTKDYRNKHSGFIAECKKQQRIDHNKEIIRLQKQMLPLFDGCCLPSQEEEVS